jgi:hypothetical protein
VRSCDGVEVPRLRRPDGVGPQSESALDLTPRAVQRGDRRAQPRDRQVPAERDEGGHARQSCSPEPAEPSRTRLARGEREAPALSVAASPEADARLATTPASAIIFFTSPSTAAFGVGTQR